MTVNKESAVEVTTTHVAYRQSQLRELASSLRWERARTSRTRADTLRVALGRRLVLIGIALLDGSRSRTATIPSR